MPSRGRRATPSGTPHQTAARVPDEDGVRAIPGPAHSDTGNLADDPWQPARAVYSFDLAAAEERDEPTVGRPDQEA